MSGRCSTRALGMTKNPPSFSSTDAPVATLRASFSSTSRDVVGSRRTLRQILLVELLAAHDDARPGLGVVGLIPHDQLDRAALLAVIFDLIGRCRSGKGEAPDCNRDRDPFGRGRTRTMPCDCRYLA